MKPRRKRRSDVSYDPAEKFNQPVSAIKIVKRAKKGDSRDRRDLRKKKH
jgi:hypothetical protein